MMNLISLAVLIYSFLNFALAGEWLTAGGQFCIDKCRYHYDNYYFYWCHVSDMTRHFSDGQDGPWGSYIYEDTSPDTHLKWDYCVPSIPSVLDNFDEYVSQGDSVENSEWSENYSGEQVTDLLRNETNIHPKGPMTTLYKLTKCNGKYN